MLALKVRPLFRSGRASLHPLDRSTKRAQPNDVTPDFDPGSSFFLLRARLS